MGVYGVGSIGSSWAAFYASRHLDVRLHDPLPSSLANGHQRALAALRILADHGLIASYDRCAARITCVMEFAEWTQDIDCVQESVSESYEVKHAVYRELDAALADDVLIMSSTSGLLMSRIQEVMAHPGRALIAHPFNPPHLIPLVELVPGRLTDPSAMETARAFFARLGKTPVILNKEVPGHIANRLAAALWREAVHLVSEGVASVEDVDKALHAGPGLRWSFMGQHLIYHLGGGPGGYRHFIDTIGRSFGEYWKDMPTWTDLPPAAAEAVVAGVADEVAGRSFAELSAWRDHQLILVLRALGERAGDLNPP